MLARRRKFSINSPTSFRNKASYGNLFSTNLLTKILIFENPKGKNFVFSVSMVSLKTDSHDSEIGGGLGPEFRVGRVHF